ncbi:MAG TPA: 4Fe-4S dicluster domain-containing protein [Ktedonobacterales bacterium]|jgi:Na+-translocating ferredoxin:NAD+ oxidoreductase RnfC subunit|nr:4Fe-4S dicluster domain-containing protein [Ktedonobacterales bacterium]
MSQSAVEIKDELAACICCSECLNACPALSEPIPIKALNWETRHGPTSPQVVRFAQACYQCGACVPVCPVGLHRDAMMLWLKVRLLRGPERTRERSTIGTGVRYDW